jgi:hypothetical protein
MKMLKILMAVILVLSVAFLLTQPVEARGHGGGHGGHGGHSSGHHSGSGHSSSHFGGHGYTAYRGFGGFGYGLGVYPYYYQDYYPYYTSYGNYDYNGYYDYNNAGRCWNAGHWENNPSGPKTWIPGEWFPCY